MLFALLAAAFAAAPGPVLPLVLPAEAPPQFSEQAAARGVVGLAGALACEPLVEALTLCYRVERDGKLHYVTLADAAAWGLPLDDLRAAAAGALDHSPLVPQEIEGGGVYHQVVAPQGREAVVLLKPEWLTAVGRFPMVAIPARGVVVVWAGGNPETDRIMAVAVRRMFDELPDPISPVVIRWDAGRWVTWGEAKPRPPAE
ncbi:MAG: hypothetical protein H6739_02670 [Alphaproteobacteria bacterium]|nr:hypothetical protein [Alphaproteobacteria bacterium]